MSPRLVPSRLFRVALLTAALVAAASLAGVETGVAQDEVTVQGLVVNGTQGAALPAELTVLMLSFDQANRLTSTHQAETDAGGRFEFTGVPLLAGGRYDVRVDYEGVLYRDAVGPEALSEDLRVTVYETTQDLSVLRVNRQVMVITGIDEKNRQVNAVEFVRLSNNSDRTLVPDLEDVGRMAFLRLSLPPQSDGLNIQSDLVGGDVISIGTGFAVTAPVTPGDHGIDFSFSFPYQGDSISYRQGLLQGAEVYQVLVPEHLRQVQVPPLEPVSPVTLGGTTYRVWEGRNYLPGQGPTLRLEGLPQPGLLLRIENTIADGTFWQASIPTLVGATLAALLVYSLLRRPGSAHAPVVYNTAPRDGDSTRRDALVRAVAALDERFQQGQVTADEYQAQRERYHPTESWRDD